MNYVWDFGSLTLDQERKYICAIINSVKFENKEVMAEMISKAHEFFKASEDVSSVSLRDIKRFKIIYSWFEKSLTVRRRPKILNENIR